MTAYHQSKTIAESHLEWASRKHIGDQIKAIRKGLGMTQNQFCDLVGVSGSYHLGAIEKGKQHPQLQLLHEIARKTETPIVIPCVEVKQPAQTFHEVTSRRPPDGSGKWITTRKLAREFGVSVSTAQQVCKRAGCKRYRGKNDRRPGTYLILAEAMKAMEMRRKR